MDLTSSQLTGLIPAMAKAANPAFLQLSPLERAGFLQEIMDQIYPVLQALPNGATGANLTNHSVLGGAFRPNQNIIPKASNSAPS